MNKYFILFIFIVSCTSGSFRDDHIFIGQTIESFKRNVVYIKPDYEGEFREEFQDYQGAFLKSTFGGVGFACTFINGHLECLIFSEEIDLNIDLEQEINRFQSKFKLSLLNDLGNVNHLLRNKIIDKKFNNYIEEVRVIDHRIEYSIYTRRYKLEMVKVKE